MKSGPENSKEFVELNFQVKFTDDEDKPLQAQVDIPQAAASNPAETNTNESNMPKVSIYDEQLVVFIGPMFMIHRGMQRSLSMKLSLHGFLKHAADPCKSQLSLLFRQFNK